MKTWLRRWLPLGEQPGAPGGELSARRSSWLRRAARLLGLLLVAASLYYLGRTIAGGMAQAELDTVTLHPWPILLSLVTTIVCVAAGGWAWQLLLKGLGYPLPLHVCLGIQVSSNLVKYIPGYAWQLVGKGYLTHKEQVPTAVVAYAMTLELGSLLLTGALVGLAFMPTGTVLPLVGEVPFWLRIGLALLLLLVVALLPLLLRWVAGWKIAKRVTRRLSRQLPQQLAPRDPWPIWGALAVMSVAWVLLGIGLGFLIQGLHPFPWQQWPLSIYSLSFSFLVSLLALFVPGGIGVREGVMAYSLEAQLPGSVAVMVAVLSRLVSVGAEVVAFGLYWLWKWATHPHNRSMTRKD